MTLDLWAYPSGANSSGNPMLIFKQDTWASKHSRSSNKGWQIANTAPRVYLDVYVVYSTH